MRRDILRGLLLIVLAMTAVTFVQSSSGSTSNSIFANSTSVSVSDSSSSTTLTQCEICMGSGRMRGDCSKAYNGAPGQYCHTWKDSFRNAHACCCPAGDVCSSRTDYECKCRQHESDRLSHWIWIGLGVFAVGVLIGGGIFTAMRMRRMQQRDSRDYPARAGMAYSQQPVIYAPVGYAQQGYAPGTYAQPVYAQGGYAQPTRVQPNIVLLQPIQTTADA